MLESNLRRELFEVVLVCSLFILFCTVLEVFFGKLVLSLQDYTHKRISATCSVDSMIVF